MARIHVVKKARKDQGVCGRCGEKITVGMSYQWVGLRPSGPGSHLVLKRCATCPPWRQSEMSFSKMAGIYAAMEMWDDFSVTDFQKADEVRDVLESVAGQVREVAEEYAESAQNMEDGLGHPTSMSEELQTKAETLEAWADEIESVDVPDAPDPEDPSTWGSYEPDEDDDAAAGIFLQALDEWRGDVASISEPTDCPV